MGAALAVDAVSVRLGAVRVLDGVSFDVAGGGVTAVLGASGSGKTTLLRAIAGFVRLESGAVRVGDRTLSDATAHVPPERRGIGYVAQEGALFPHLRVGANIGFGLPRSERTAARTGEALELVGLPAAYAERRPEELSGGEQQRVALARALVPGPAVILLDEPFSGLDTALRAETRGAVLGALAATGATAILVTHDQPEAMSMGDRVVLLRTGRLVQHAPPAELYAAPADLDAARFLGEAVVLPGTRAGSTVQCALGVLGARGDAGDGDVQAMLRPEQLELRGDGGGGVTGTVGGREYLGSDVLVTVALDGGVTVRARTFSHAAPAGGARVAVAVRGDAVVYPAS